MHIVYRLALRHHLLLIVVGLFLYFSYHLPFFASWFNILNLLRESGELGIICLGATLVVLIGRLDLSVGALLAASALIVIVGFKVWELAYLMVILLAILFGLLAGALNGVLTTICKVPSFIATLGSLVIFRGIVQWATATEAVRGANGRFTTDPEFLFPGSGLVAGVPFSVCLFMGIFVCLVVLTKFTRVGTAIYAMGGNREAARRAGIQVNAIEICIFSFAGMCAATAGVLLASRLDSVSFQTGQYLEFTVLIAVIVGGTSITGGIGGVVGTLYGIGLVGVLNNGMVMMAIDRDSQDVVLALFLIGALLLDRYLNQALRGIAARPRKDNLVGSSEGISR
jgi:ribose/xylose/arabinose/galactoside ABC-type transport system permease subunit